MLYTNKHNLPDLIVEWLKFDEYDYEPGVYSATALIAPTRQTILKARYFDQLEVDVSDQIASRLGTAIHSSFEKIPFKNTIQEKRFYALIDGIKISGKPDMLLDTNLPVQTLVDIKSTSAWTYVYGSKDEEFIKQLSIYRYILKDAGFNVEDTAYILYLFTDWKKSDALRNPDYPPLRMRQKNIELLCLEEILLYIRERLTLLAENANTPDGLLPFCTDAELWKGEITYAVMKEERKTAVRVLNNEKEAEQYIKDNNVKKASIVKRGGLARRCNYCPVTRYCNQYERLIERMELEQ